MTEITKARSLGSDAEVRDELINAAYECLECGKCTGSCPMVQLFPNDFHPHHLLLDLVHNPEEALKGANLWLCASCYKCNKRCPQAIEFPFLVMKMRSLALKENGADSIKKAYEKIRKNIPFPLSFLSVCVHPERINLDPAILENFHRENMSDTPEINIKGTGQRIAIVGSGPAGLMAGFELRKMGYGIRIFEAESVAGGMFSLAIPEYRVPLNIIRDEVRILEKLGVEIQLNTRIGPEFTIEKLFGEGYQAVLLALGSHRCKTLDIPGNNFEGSFNSLGFLQALKINNRDIRNKTVTIIGGGNTAMDTGSVAMKYGAKEVFLLYRRTREEMPADINEIRETENDGVQIRFLESPLSIHGEKSKVSMLECIKMELGEADMTGRRKPVPLEGSNFSMDSDLVVFAIGEQPDTGQIHDELTTGKDGSILVNPFTMETSMPGVFAAGDSTSGPATVADAILGARKAAIGIDTKLTYHDNG